MKKLLTSLLLISLVTVSCKKDETETSVATDSNPTTVLESNNAYLMEASRANAVQVQNTESNTAQPATTPNGMNPPHGQPGHRCEIAVGAPLNSTPNPANTTQKTTINNNTVTQTNAPQVVAPNNNGSAVITPTNQKTPAGMNPPHGQEGHRCEIAVGAPLPVTN